MLMIDPTVLSLRLPWPPSINHYYGTRVIGKRAIRYIGKKGKDFREEVKNLVSSNLEHAEKYFTKDARLDVIIRVHSPDRRRRDIDNLCKATLDALQHAGIYADDTNIDALLVVRDREDIVKGGNIVVSIGVIQCDE